MGKHLRVVHTLRDLLAAPASGASAPGLLRVLVQDCSAIALTLIQSKISSGTIDPSRFGLSPPDMAMDAIADLFRQDDDGKFVQITSYFEGMDWRTMEDEELLVHIRRLIFARTNRGLYRMFQEIDPGLGKILRNTKIAIAALANFEEHDYFGEPCIAPGLCDPLPRAPMVERNDLISRMISMTRGDERIPEILALLSRYLREQNGHSRMVPVLWVAYGIRAIYARTDQPQTEEPSVENSLAEADLRAILCEAGKHTHAKYHAAYVTPDGLSQQMFDDYFKVINGILIKRFLSNDGHDVSLFNQLQQYVPGLTREEYNAAHRSKLEYLARMAEQKAVQMLKRNIQS